MRACNNLNTSICFNYKEIAEILDKDSKAIDNAIRRIKIKAKNYLNND